MQLELVKYLPTYNRQFLMATLVEQEEENTVTWRKNVLTKLALYFVAKRLANYLKKLNDKSENELMFFEERFKSKISSNKRDELIEIHKLLSKTLENNFLFEERINPSNSQELRAKNEIQRFNKILKELELTARILLYPERNEVILSYDELRELRGAFKDFQIIE